MTRLFAPVAGPRVLALPPGVDFTAALARGLDARLAGMPPEAAAAVEIWVNTRRARRTLLETFAAGGVARLLPRVRVIADLVLDPELSAALPAPEPPLRRRLQLARLVRAMAAAAPGLAGERAVFDLAESLGDLLDEVRGEGLAADAFAAVDPGAHAAHWQVSLRFLEILAAHDASGLEGAARLRVAADAQAAEWAVRPPDHPVIVAGSTGSRAPTRAFMAAVAQLPQGAVVLPGLDPHLPRGVWERLVADDVHAADHPQYGFARLAEVLGFDPAAVPGWDPVREAAPERNILVSLALRPAPVTDQWRREGMALKPDLAAAMAEVTWLDAPDARSEARAIALALRDAAAAGQRGALVTADRSLARRVTAELDRWGIIPDDSAGRPLGLTPPGVLLRRLAALPGRPLGAEELLDLLRHPLVASAPGARAGHRRLTRRLETGRLRGGAPWIDWDALAAWAMAEGGTAPAWITWLRSALEPLESGAPKALPALAARHRAAAECLATGPGGGAVHDLWQEDAGQQALALMEELAAEADIFGPMGPGDFAALLESLLAARDVPEAAMVTHAGVAIWGTLEARVQAADLVILGGLNEGVWPKLPPADPWLSRPMRRQLGLPSPESQLGLAAHDFQQAMGAARVILARAERDAEAPTVPGRWLLRLGNLLEGLGDEGKAALDAARHRGAALLARGAGLDRLAGSLPPAPRPSARPPAAARPAALSVTQVETLVRDPYAIYAKKVLGLRRLDPPGRQADALTRGTAIHGALDAFVTETAAALPPDAAAVFERIVARELGEAAPWPAVRARWIARLRRAAPTFLEGEASRRLRGWPARREVTGSREIDDLPRPFRLHAKADRIDVTRDGRFAIYDYKSGGVPSEPEAEKFHLQLRLEALILEAGGFEGLPPGEAAHLEILGIGSGEGRVQDGSPEALATVMERLRTLVAHYQAETNGFTSRLRPQKLNFDGDYDHLARFGEWSESDPPEGGNRGEADL